MPSQLLAAARAAVRRSRAESGCSVTRCQRASASSAARGQPLGAGVGGQPEPYGRIGARAAEEPLHLGQLFRPPRQPSGTQQMQQADLHELMGARPDLLGLRGQLAGDLVRAGP